MRYHVSKGWIRCLWLHKCMLEKSSHETSLDLDSCFDHNRVQVSSAGLRQPHQCMNTSGSESNNSVVKLFHFQQKSWIHGLVCVPSAGFYTTQECILMARVQNIGYQIFVEVLLKIPPIDSNKVLPATNIRAPNLSLCGGLGNPTFIIVPPNILERSRVQLCQFRWCF